jgi:hypothetical protein
MKRVDLLRLVGALALAGVALLSPGCSSKHQARIVSGRVTYDGNPVIFGQITLYQGDVVVGVASIGPDGTYTMNVDEVEGPCEVAVLTLTAVPECMVRVVPGTPIQTPPGQAVTKEGSPGSRLKQPLQPPPDAAKPGPGGKAPPDGGPPPIASPPGMDGSPMVVTFNGPDPVSLPPDLKPDAKATLAAIHKKYSTPGKSGLTFDKTTVGSTFDIALEKGN